MADHVKVKTLEVEGKRFDIYVSDYRGEFQAVPEGLPPGHPNVVASDWVYDKLLPILKRRTKEAKTRVEVPFCVPTDGVLRMGTARGIHGSKGTVLVTWSDGSKGELDRYGRNTYAVPPQEVIEQANAKAKEVARLREELVTAEKSLDALLKPYAMHKDYGHGGGASVLNLRDRVQAAITATISGEQEKEAS
jgi:hypothetical protein